MMNKLSFKVTPEEREVIKQIADRAILECYKSGSVVCDHEGCLMDISACHASGNPLKLEELLAADKFNFAHDVVGIHMHIDRGTGQLKNCFSPRYSK